MPGLRDLLDCLGQRLLLLPAQRLGRLVVAAGLAELRQNHERVPWLDFRFHDFCSYGLMADMTLPVCECRCSPSPRGRTGQRRTWIPSNLKRGPCEDSPIPDSTDQPHPNCLRTTAASLQRTFRSRKDFENQKTQSPDSLRRSGLRRLLLAWDGWLTPFAVPPGCSFCPDSTNSPLSIRQ